IQRQIKERILRGELKEGDPLPSIRQLARDLRISVITTKRAYDELEKEGLITSVVGKGSFVAGQNRAFLRESRPRWSEGRFAEIVSESEALRISAEELRGMLPLLYEERWREGGVFMEEVAVLHQVSEAYADFRLGHRSLSHRKGYIHGFIGANGA